MAITDGRRIAELLASELTGLSVGPLKEVTVVDADQEAIPANRGTYAYAINYSSDRIGEVRIRPTCAILDMEDTWSDTEATETDGLHLEGNDLVIEKGAAVKQAVDAIRVYTTEY